MPSCNTVNRTHDSRHGSRARDSSVGRDALVKHLEGKSFEVTLIIGHLRDDVDATHPLCDVVLLFKLGLEDIFREDQHALDLAKHLQIVARDLVAAEVSLTLQRVVEHWQDSVLHLVFLAIDLLSSWLRL